MILADIANFGETRLYLQHTRKIMNYTNLINSVYNLKWDLRK